MLAGTCSLHQQGCLSDTFRVMDYDSLNADDTIVDWTTFTIPAFTTTVGSSSVTPEATSGSTTVSGTTFLWGWSPCNSGQTGASCSGTSLSCTACGSDPSSPASCAQSGMYSAGTCGYGVDSYACASYAPTFAPTVPTFAPAATPTVPPTLHPCTGGTHNCNTASTYCGQGQGNTFTCECLPGFHSLILWMLSLRCANVRGDRFSNGSPDTVSKYCAHADFHCDLHKSSHCSATRSTRGDANCRFHD
jgi:hypothetical protein